MSTVFTAEKFKIKPSETLKLAQKRVLELMAFDAPLAEVLEALLQMIEAQSKSGLMGSIHVVDSDGRNLCFGAAPSLPAGYNQAYATVPLGTDLGPCATSAFLKSPVNVPDIAKCERWNDFREFALQHGLGACWSIPIFTGSGEVLGTFAMYYPTACEPHINDLHLVEIAIRTTAIAIERNRAQETLRASEKRFRTIVNQTITGVVQTDPEGYITLVNQRWCDMLGYSETELLGMNILDVTHEDSRVATREAMMRLADGGPNYVIEKCYVRRDDTFFWASNSVNALRNRAGDYRGLVAVVLDISESKRVAEALQASEKNSRHILQSITDGFFALNENWLFTYVNRAAESILDHAADDLIGKSIWDSCPSLAGNEFECNYRRVHDERTALTFTAYSPEHQRWYEMQAYPAKHGITVYFRNATEQIEAQEKLRVREANAMLIADISARLVFRSPNADPESVDELLESVFFSMARHLNVEFYFNFVADEASKTLRLVSSQGITAEQQAMIAHIGYGEHLSGTVALQRKPLILEGSTQVCSMEQADALCAMGASACAGYPLLADGHLLGTISFATSRRPRFSDEELELMQTVTDMLAVAIQRDRTSQAVFSSEQKYRRLFDSIDEGFCTIEVLFDGNQPVDFRYLETSPSFEKQTGIANAVGKTIRELVPDIEQHWIDTHGRVALTGESERVEGYAAQLQRWFSCYAFCINSQKNLVGNLFSDITERKRRELNLGLIAEIQQDFAVLTNTQAMLQTVGEKIHRHFGFASLAFSDINGRENTANTVYSTQSPGIKSATGLHSISDFFSEKHLAQLKAGKVVAIDDISQAELPAQSSAYKQYQAAAVINVPALSDGHLKFLISGSHREPYHWRDDEIELLSELTTRIYPHLARVRTEVRIHESEQRYRALVDASSQILYRMKADLAALVIIKGGGLVASSSEPEPDWLEKYIHPEDRVLVVRTWQEAIRNSSLFEVEHRVLHMDGSWGWVFSRAVPVRDAHGDIIEWFGAASDITRRKQAEDSLWQSANYDHLTGLPNRRLFRDRLEQEIKKARRNGHALALFFIDLDHFKQVNDMHGHMLGDTLLIEASKRINACVREFDTVARLGGDEFTAILSDLEDTIHIEQVAQKIIECITKPFQLVGEVVHISASIGITFFPNDAGNADDLIRNADQAMYAAKYAGRNQYHYFLQSMQHEALDRLRLIEDLRNACNQGEFEVYYQPVIDLSSGRIVKAEALLRWNHPTQGRVDPSVFIPFAEDSGLINEIGDWVFTEAAACSKICEAERGEPFQISVNKSPLQFRNNAKNINWINYLSRNDLPPSSISIEITEGLLLNTSKETRNKLRQFRRAGIQVAIDDFGTGYSSLAYLKEFEIDYLKIDQSFIHDMSTEKANFAIVRSMIAMAHELEIKVIAEGIETENQHELLVNAGCDYGQGFLFSEALPPSEFLSMLKTNSAQSLSA